MNEKRWLIALALVRCFIHPLLLRGHAFLIHPGVASPEANHDQDTKKHPRHRCEYPPECRLS
jgi:hypothetical protein